MSQLSLRFSAPGNFEHEVRQCATRSRWGIAGMDWEVHKRKLDDYGYCYSHNSISSDFGRGWPFQSWQRLTHCLVADRALHDCKELNCEPCGLHRHGRNLILQRLRSLPESVVAKAIPLCTWPVLHECNDWWFEPIRVWPTTKRNGNYNSIIPDFGRLASIYDHAREGWSTVRFAKWEFIEVHKRNDQSKFKRLQGLADWRYTETVALIDPDEVEEFAHAVWRYGHEGYRHAPLGSVMDGQYMHHRWWVHPAADRAVSWVEYWEVEAARRAA